MSENNINDIFPGIKAFVFDNSNDFIVIADAETGKFIEVNNSSVEKSGYSREELLNLSISDIDPGLASKSAWKDFKDKLAASKKHIFEGTLKTKSGTIIPVEVNSSLVEANGHSYIIGIARNISKRKITERQMRIFMEVADNANYGVALLDLKGNIEYSNRYFAESHGFLADEILTRNIADICRGSRTMKTSELFAYTVKNGMLDPVELIHVRKDGAFFPALVSGVLVHDEKGDPLYVACTSIDITKRVLDEIKIRESSELHKTLIESAPDAIYALDSEGKYLSVNPAAAAYFGKSPAEMVGRNISDFYPEQMASRMVQNIKNVMESDESISLYNVPYPTGMGTFIFDTTLSPINSSDGTAEYVLGISRNMTARFTAIEGLKNSEERLRNIFSASPDFIIQTNSELCVGDANDTFLEWIGMEKEDILGISMHEFTSPSTRFRLGDAAKKLAEEQTVRGLETTFINKEGATCQVELNCARMTGKNNNFEFIFIGRDITDKIVAEEEMKGLREQLVHSQKMEAVGKLAGGIAHDFNNLLSVIRGNADIALSRLQKDSDSSEYLVKSMKAMDKARELTTNLLTFSRKEKPKMIPVSAMSLLNDTINLVERSLPKSVKIKFVEKQDCCRIEADVNQLQQAFLNIIINAADAMPDGGVIDISTSCEQVEHNNPVTAPGLSPGSYCVIRIQDNGTGIPQSIINKVMEPFFTTKEPGKGTGLGLSITHSIITEHKGEVVISSIPGEGTTISLYLPSLSDSDVEKCELANAQDTTGKVVYIVDDDEDFADMISDALDISGFRPLAAPQGISGIETFRKLKDDIDIVLIDIQMPDMDGEKYLEKILEIKPGMKAVLCSGMKPRGTAEKILKDNRCGFIQKPFNINELCAAINKELLR